MPLSKPPSPATRTPSTPKRADWSAPAGPTEWETEFEPRFAIGRGQFGVVYLLQHADGRKAVDKRVELSGMNDQQKD